MGVWGSVLTVSLESSGSALDADGGVQAKTTGSEGIMYGEGDREFGGEAKRELDGVGNDPVGTEIPFDGTAGRVLDELGPGDGSTYGGEGSSGTRLWGSWFKALRDDLDIKRDIRDSALETEVKIEELAAN